MALFTVQAFHPNGTLVHEDAISQADMNAGFALEDMTPLGILVGVLQGMSGHPVPGVRMEVKNHKGELVGGLEFLEGDKLQPYGFVDKIDLLALATK